MSTPWDLYAAAAAAEAETGPWTKYQAQAQEPMPPAPSGPPRRYVNPTRGQSAAKRAGRGALRFAEDVSLGRRQIATGIADALGLEGAADEQRTLAGIADIRKQNLDPAQRTPAAQAGYLGAALVPALGMSMVPGANTVAGAGAIGAGMGFMQPVGSTDSRAWNTGTGAVTGAAGQGAFNLIGRVAQPVKSGLNRAGQRAVDLLESRGVSLSAGQRTGSRAMQAIERMLGDNPVSAGSMAKQGEKFRDSYTRAVLRTIGENADGATPDVLGRARDRIGSVFDDVASRYDLDVTTPGVANKINALERRAKDELLEDGRLTRQIDLIRESVQQHGGKLPGETYKNLKTTLDNLSHMQNIGPYAAELRALLDDALATATKGTRDYARLGEARAQYRNLMAIADVADTTAHGRVSPAALASRLKSNKYTRNSMRYGKGDAELAKLARAGSTVVDRFPQSGTAPRAAAQLVLPGAVGAAQYVLSDDKDAGAALKAAAWTYGMSKAGGALATNPAVQNWLAQGIGQPVLRNALLAPSRLGLGAMVPAYLLAQE